jgi:hypothetical protein
MPRLEAIYERIKGFPAEVNARRGSKIETPEPRRIFTFGVEKPTDPYLLDFNYDPVARQLEILAEQQAKRNS